MKVDSEIRQNFADKNNTNKNSLKVKLWCFFTYYKHIQSIVIHFVNVSEQSAVDSESESTMKWAMFKIRITQVSAHT